jgi:O-antigen/teichoic acid export membrane protein
MGTERMEEPPTFLRRRVRSGIRGNFAWAFVGQAFSSATNFALTLGAGRLLGPSGLGVVVIGYAAYQLIAGLARAVLTQPVIAHSAPLPADERHWFARVCMTIVGAVGIVATFVLAGVGLIVGGSVGRGVLIFAPWVLVSLLQEFWKAILFQEGRGGAAAASDAVRFGVLALTLPIAFTWKNDYVVVSAWGLSAAAGLLVAIAFYRVRPEALPVAIDAWRSRASRLGRWLGAREVGYQIFTYATILSLALILGTRDLGGLRSAEALFSPFSLIAAALVLPALPALSRAAADSHATARTLAFRVGALATAAGLAYIVPMLFVGNWLLAHLFGHSFAPFGGLVWAMASAQVFSAAGFSFTVLLSAERRGRASFVAGLVGAAGSFAFAITLAAVNGVTGAAWGMAIGSAIGSFTVIQLGLRPVDVKSRTVERN